MTDFEDIEPHEADEVAVPAQEVDEMATMIAELRDAMHHQATHNAPVTPAMLALVDKLADMASEH